MANLRVNKITSTETFETTGSVQFDGDGDFLTLADSGDWDHKQKFTWETWIYLNSYDTSGALIVEQRSSGGSTGVQWYINTSNEIIFNQNASTSLVSATNTFTTGVWHHLAVCHDGSTIRIFMDGVLANSASTSTVPDNVSEPLRIGRVDGSTNYDLNGYLSNLRFVNGTALYTENFKPPMRELTVTPETVLLACQHKTDASHEKTGKTITVNGNAVANELTPGLLTDVVKSGGSSAVTGSVEFDGSTTVAGGDYLRVDDSGDFDFGTGDFTIEFWMKPALEDTSKYTDSLSAILDHDATAGITGAWFVVHQNNKKIAIAFDSATQLSTSNFLDTQSWHHVALTRSGNTFTIFGNGVDVGNVTSSFDISDSTARELDIGKQVLGSNNRTFEGFLSNLRIVKGTALYTDNFIPPTRELKKVPGTVLLCCQDENSVTTEATGKTITSNGDPAASNFTPQVGNDGSVEFVGPTKINTENYFYLPTGDTVTRDSRSGRGLIVGGSNSNSIEYINITTQGNAQDFGDLTSESSYVSACSSSTRGICFVSRTPATPAGGNTLDYVTIASTGNSQDFGDTTAPRYESAAASSNTRGLIAGGYLGPGSGTPANSVVIDYVTIASTGDAIAFGDLTYGRRGLTGLSSPTRGCFAAGYQQPDTTTETNIIDYVTIASTGNATDFGDLIAALWGPASLASSTRGIWAGGIDPNATNVIGYVTIASTGNAQDFGDLTSAPDSRNTGMSNSIRGVICISSTNRLDYITISTTGNAQDFGDSVKTHSAVRGGCSDSHGGLG